MRGLIIGVAVVCYAAALVLAWAAMRVPVPLPARTMTASPAAAPASLPQPLLQSPPEPPAERLPATVEDLAREQVDSRQVVVELRATVARLQEEVDRQSADLLANETQGRMVAVICCDLIPAGQQTFRPQAAEFIRAALPEIMNDARRIVAVEGHTDSRPINSRTDKPFKDNVDLSLLRARAVAALLERYGVAAGRIRIRGWGDTRPLATNDTAEGRDRNRRVEIRLLLPSAQR